MKTTKKTSGLKMAVYALLLVYSCVTLIPFIWTVITSLKTTAEISSGLSFLPEDPTFAAYEQIFRSKLVQWLINSATVSFATMILNLVFNTMAAYALARLQFRGRNALFSLLLALIMVPAQVTMIPTYMIVAKLGLINTQWAIILTSAVNIAYIFMMRQFFINFPRDIEEAAAIDGLSKIGIFFRIVLPGARPALATQAIFIFMGIWNEFMKPLLYISSPESYMLTQGLNALAKEFKNATAWNVIMAGALISIIPIFIAYIFLNKYFVTTNDQSAGVK